MPSLAGRKQSGLTAAEGKIVPEYDETKEERRKICEEWNSVEGYAEEHAGRSKGSSGVFSVQRLVFFADDAYRAARMRLPQASTSSLLPA